MYTPEHVFVYDGVKKSRRTEDLLSKFPKAKVSYIDNQAPNYIRSIVERIYGKPETLGQVINRSKKTLVVGSGSKQSFVDKFVNEWDCICPSFYSITPMSNGCFYSCEFCYLQLTYRGIYPYMKANINLEDLESAIKDTVVREHKKNPEKRVNFNCGEKLDSLAFDKYFNTTGRLLPLFGEKKLARAELLLLTKSEETDGLIDYAGKHGAPPNVVVSWSLNGTDAAVRFEHDAPTPRRRLFAAKRCENAGYRIRLRIDPMIYREGWKEDYRRLIGDMADLGIKPEVITIGSLRFDGGLPSISRNRFPNSSLFKYSFIVEGKDKYRYKPEHRTEMYRFAIDEIRKQYAARGLRQPAIGLCKEKSDVWKRSGLTLKDGACNCCGSWSDKKPETETLKVERPAPQKQTEQKKNIFHSNCKLSTFR